MHACCTACATYGAATVAGAWGRGGGATDPGGLVPAGYSLVGRASEASASVEAEALDTSLPEDSNCVAPLVGLVDASEGEEGSAAGSVAELDDDAEDTSENELCSEHACVAGEHSLACLSST